MINIYKGLKNYNKLRDFIGGIRDLDTLVNIFDNHSKVFNITNDLRETKKMIDVNFENICATIEQNGDYLSLHEEVEVWDDDGSLNFVSVNMYAYSQYNTRIREDGKIQITSSHPYDEQKYHYAIGNKIYRNGKYVETIKESEDHFIDGLDEIILRLIELNRPLKPIMCHN